jgi:hypothetical protein
LFSNSLFFYIKKHIVSILSSWGKDIMEKNELLKIIEKLLKPDVDLNFLLDLPEEHLETLIACIRDRIDQLNNKE